MRNSINEKFFRNERIKYHPLVECQNGERALILSKETACKSISINHSNIQYQLAANKNSLNQYMKKKYFHQSLALFTGSAEHSGSNRHDFGLARHVAKL